MRGRVYVRGSIISIHALLTESDPRKMALQCSYRAFLSTLSLRRATALRRDKAVAMDISIHALLTESDRCTYRTNFRPCPFLSTLSLRRATKNSLYDILRNEISIHALLTESDVFFSTPSASSCIFLSTLSLRRATHTHVEQPCTSRHFYPRSPYGERPFLHVFPPPVYSISIHALLTESDSSRIISSSITAYFYPRSPYGERRRPTYQQGEGQAFLSTLSLRRATRCHRSDNGSPIHFYPRSPYGERPLTERRSCTTIRYFYPRSPYGERQLPIIEEHLQLVFLSTLSLRRATSAHRLQAAPVHNFYPRSPYGERLPLLSNCCMTARHFYPRSPYGERRCQSHYGPSHLHFYPRSPYGERPGNFRIQQQSDCYFYPRSPYGERQY